MTDNAKERAATMDEVIALCGFKSKDVLFKALKDQMFVDPSMAHDVVSLATTEIVKHAINETRLERIEPLLTAVMFLMDAFVLGRDKFTKSQKMQLDRFILPSLKKSPDIASETCSIGEDIRQYLSQKGEAK